MTVLLRSLRVCGLQEANHTFNSKKGKVWINLEVGLQCPQPLLGNHYGHDQGNARQRRKIRRAAAHAKKVTEEVTEEPMEAVQVEEPNRDADKDARIDVTGASAQEVAYDTEQLTSDATEKRNIDLQSKIKLLEEKEKDMVEEHDFFLLNTFIVHIRHYYIVVSFQITLFPLPQPYLSSCLN